MFEEKYGIEIVSFVLKETRFGDKLVEAAEEKKRRELIAEAEKYAADQEASCIRKLYAAYVDGIASFMRVRLNQFKPPVGWINGTIEWGLSF